MFFISQEEIFLPLCSPVNSFLIHLSCSLIPLISFISSSIQSILHLYLHYQLLSCNRSLLDLLSLLANFFSFPLLLSSLSAALPVSSLTAVSNDIVLLYFLFPRSSYPPLFSPYSNISYPFFFLFIPLLP